VGAVAGAQEGDTLVGSPEIQLFQIQLAARGPGVMGMDVEVGDEFHYKDGLQFSVSGFRLKDDEENFRFLVSGYKDDEDRF
jgi:hypothetical protein